jgi:hypothetical protein
MTTQSPERGRESLGPATRAYFAMTLPANQGGSVVAIAEDHNLAGYLKTLRSNYDNLISPNQNNVGTIGVELSTYFNVLYWAAQDGKLPVSSGKERAYFKQMVLATYEQLKHNSEANRTDFLFDAISKNTRIVAFDTRKNLEDLRKYLGNPEQGLKALGVLNEKQKQALREDETAFDQWLDSAERTMISRLPKELTQNAPAGAIRKDASLIWFYTEIKDLLDRNPQYKLRLEQIENTAKQMADRGVGEDGQSAAVFVSQMNRSKNAITLSGLAHIIGHVGGDVQGTFASHMSQYGLKVYPTIISDSAELAVMASKLIPNSIFYTILQQGCAARAPMRIVVPDRDTVLDISDARGIRILNPEITETASSIARELARSGARLTCDRPELPSTADCAKREIEGKGPCQPPRR